jgi:hypothetical protein
MTALEMFKKDLALQLLEAPLRLTENRIKRLETSLTPMVNEFEVSVYIEHVPVNSGPEHLTVLSSLWQKPILSLEDGTGKGAGPIIEGRRTKG